MNRILFLVMDGVLNSTPTKDTKKRRRKDVDRAISILNRGGVYA